MKDSKTIISHVAQEISRSTKGSQIGAGQTKIETPVELIDSINQIFTLFSINYNNQYYKAFKDEELELQAKRLWLESLRGFNVDTLLRGAKEAIKTSEFLPTIHGMIKCCQKVSNFNLPDTHSAYVEACNAPSPKTEASWRHPIVYLAGKESGWYFLANNIEKIAYPIFRSHYEKLCQRVMNGEEFDKIKNSHSEEMPAEPLSKEENIQRMEKLRQEMGI